VPGRAYFPRVRRLEWPLLVISSGADAPAGGDAVTAMLTATGEHAAASDSLTGTGVVPSHLYWADVNAGTIVEADLDGTGAQVIASGQGGPAEVAVGQQ